jgi:large subunit ribosomal protein L37Ae
VETIEEKMHEKHRCPQCGRNSVERVATSIWRCRKCGTRFAGGAYIPETASGKIALRAIKGTEAGENV